MMKFTFTHKHASGTQSVTYNSVAEAFYAAGKHFGGSAGRNVRASDYPSTWSDATIVLFHHKGKDCFLYALASIVPVFDDAEILTLCK
jgi:hypothetical protein